MKINRRETTRNIRKMGFTLKGWAQRNNFNYNTVSSVLSGQGIKHQVGEAGRIIGKLKRDGHLVLEEPDGPDLPVF